jgi:hypothetical protein
VFRIFKPPAAKTKGGFLLPVNKTKLMILSKITSDLKTMSITIDFIRSEIENESYEISLHADNERLNDELTLNQLEQALVTGEIIEYYQSDARGESCLIYGVCDDVNIHIVCGKNRQQHLIIITVYIPSMPKWLNPYMRNREERLK